MRNEILAGLVCVALCVFVSPASSQLTVTVGGQTGVLTQRGNLKALTTLREKLIKIGAKVVRHSRQIVFKIFPPENPNCTA